MSSGAARPVIFISYSHKDEPDHPRDGEVAWLSFVRTYLQPAIKHGIFDLFVDEHIPGGADLKPEIERKLRACDIFLLLISPNSAASDYIIDTEIAITRERQEKGEAVVFYPLLLTPTPKVALDKFKDKVIRPKDAKALSSHSYSERIQAMSDIADEIAEIAAGVVSRKPPPPPRPVQPNFVHISGLPETPYEHLVGRDRELGRLDDAWADKATNVLSLIAEGGAGKSALVNEWLKRMQAGNYRGAESVLGWSFYSQGTKERATSADQFLNWAMEKLGIALETTSATAKGDAIAEALMQRRVLLVLDGVEPLQHGPDGQLGQLKDQGLRALLRRFAAAPPTEAQGLIVLTSRLAVTDIAGRKDGAAPIVDLEKLSDDAGSALLRDNGVWGTDKELKQASHDFGGHPLALGLLASFLKETQHGDIRRRDHIRKLVAGTGNPGQDHAARVMESYEKEWLAGQPELLAIMQIVGLFDRPASADCLKALRAKPTIAGLTDAIVTLDEDAWQRAIARLRDVRLLSPPDPSAPGALDAHPLLREWFGSRLKETNEAAWKTAHGRLYEHLRDSTKEGDWPSLEQLAPLYQAIAHGCRAGRHQEVLDEVYADRICKRAGGGEFVFYSSKVLGAVGSDLAAISWFFDKPYETPVGRLRDSDRSWVLNDAAISLRAMGRLAEALPATGACLRMDEDAKIWRNASAAASNLSETALLAGDVSDALKSAETSVAHADRSGNEFLMVVNRVTLADALHAAGRFAEAERLFANAQQRQIKGQPEYPLLYALQGYRYCDLLLAGGDFVAVRDRVRTTLEWSQAHNFLLDIALDTLSLARAHFGLARSGSRTAAREAAYIAGAWLDKAVDGLRAAGQSDHLPRGLFARAAFGRCIGDGASAARDLDEVEEIAEPGPMKLFLCDLALERTRLAFAMIEAFAPLNGMIDDSPPKPEVPSAAKRKELHDEAAKQLAIAADYIATCGYHRRDAELAELQAVLKDERKFSDLPPRV
jgi:tetratricopeptide (TPR) repeat protein